MIPLPRALPASQNCECPRLARQPSPAGVYLEGRNAKATYSVARALGDRIGVALHPAPGGGTDRVLLERAELPEPTGLPQAVGVHPSGEPTDESYAICPTPDGWRIQASTEAGMFHGLVTVLQHQVLARPLGHLLDAPGVAWRGLSLDIARNFRSPGEIETIIDLLALYKMSVLHLHLSDNQGWRLESRAYPNLTSGDAHLTRAEYRHLVQYAAERHVTIVPEIDMPGHTAAALRAYPDLAGDIQFPHPLIRYLSPRVPSAMAFARTVLTELADLTPTPFLHVGGDEAFGMPAQIFAEFFANVIPHVHALGKRAVAWQEVTRTGALSSRDLVQLWISDKDAFDAATLRATTPAEHHHLIDLAEETFLQAPGDARRAAQQGAAVILSPSSPLYFDRRHAHPSARSDQEERRERVGFPAYEPEPLSAIHDFDPFSHSRDQGVVLAGVEAALWAETITSFEDVSFLLLPRLPIAAERMWSAPAIPYAALADRLRGHEAMWTTMGITEYFQHP